MLAWFAAGILWAISGCARDLSREGGAPVDHVSPATPEHVKTGTQEHVRPATPESMCADAPAFVQAKVRVECGPAFAALDTKHFRLISDCSSRLSKLMAGSLEQFYVAMHDRFFKAELTPVTVYVVEAAADYGPFLARRGQGPPGGGGFGHYDPRERVIYSRHFMPDGSESGIGTLFNLAVHAMLESDFESSDVPPWIGYGFAAAVEQGRLLNGEWVWGNPNPWRDAAYRPMFESGAIPSLSAFLAMGSARFEDDFLINVNTARSICLWLLLMGDEKLAAYVELARAGKGGVDAIEGASGMKLAEVEMSWRNHVRTFQFGGDYVYRASKANEEDALKILAEGAEKHPRYGVLRAEYAKRLLAAGRKDDARREAEAALSDPRFPLPALAWNVLLACSKPDDRAGAARAATAIIGLQPWLEGLESEAYETYASLLESDGQAIKAAEINAELARLRLESLPARQR